MFWVARKISEQGRSLCRYMPCHPTAAQAAALHFQLQRQCQQAHASECWPAASLGSIHCRWPLRHFNAQQSLECRCCQWDLAEEHVHLTSRMQHDAAPPHTTAAGAADDLEEINEDPTAAVRGIMRNAGLELLEQACPECWDAQRRMVSTHPTS